MKLCANLIMAMAVIWLVPNMVADSPISLSKVVVALKPDKDPDAMIAERAQLSSISQNSWASPLKSLSRFLQP